MFFRPLERSDLEWFVSVRNEVRGMLHDPREFNLEQAIEWFEKSETKYWIINKSGHNVGYFRILETAQSRVLIGADIAPEHQGKRIASSSYPKFIEQILLPLGFTELELRVLKKNTRAINLYLSLGFTIDEETSIDYHMFKSANEINN